jgi:hypothetical protein
MKLVKGKIYNMSKSLISEKSKKAKKRKREKEKNQIL